MEKFVNIILRECAGAVIMLGIYDALSANIAVRAGFGSLFVTGDCA